MSMVGAQTSYHVAEIGSGHHPYVLTPLDFLPTPATYETDWHFSVNKEDLWLMLCTFPKDKMKEFSAWLYFEQNIRCQDCGRRRREYESWNMIRYTCITEEAIKVLDRFCMDLRSAEVSPQLVTSCFCIMAMPTGGVQ